MADIGKQIRLNRLLRRTGNKALIVAYDHAQMLGPIPGTEQPAKMLQQLLEAEVDGILLSLGGLRIFGSELLQRHPPGIIVRLDWTNAWYREHAAASGDYASCAVGAVEDAVRYGADAVITYLFLGSGNAVREAKEVQKNAAVTRACERFGVAHVIESMARGVEAPDPYHPEWIRRHARMAAELGADLIKTDYTGDANTMRSVVECCPVPVLAAGGARSASDTEALTMFRGVAASGAAGVIFGRNIFQAPDVRAFVAEARQVMDTAHTNACV